MDKTIAHLQEKIALQRQKLEQLQAQKKALEARKAEDDRKSIVERKSWQGPCF